MEVSPDTIGKMFSKKTAKVTFPKHCLTTENYTRVMIECQFFGLLTVALLSVSFEPFCVTFDSI